MPNERVPYPTRLTILPAMIVVWAAVALSPAARADWPVNGLAVCADPSGQYAPSLTSDGTGGAFITWVDLRPSTSGFYVQRVTGGGETAAGWPVNGVRLSGSYNAYAQASITPDGNGGAFVAWGGNLTICIQHITALGEVAAGWPNGGTVLATTPQLGSALVASDGAGGAIVTWSSGASCRLLRIVGDGTLPPGWSPGGVAVGGLLLAPDGAGGGFVVWKSYPGTSIYLQRIASNGVSAPGWPVNGISIQGIAVGPYPPTIVADGAGGAYIAWCDDRNSGTTKHDICLQRITAAGAVAGGWPSDGFPVCRAAREQDSPFLVEDGTGGVIVLWRDRRNDPSADLYAQRVTPEAALAPGWPVDGAVVCDVPGPELFSWFDVVEDGAGGALFTWSDSRDLATTGMDIYVQHLAADGTPAPGWPDDGLALCAATGSQESPMMAANGRGGAIVAWQDRRATEPDIYAALINGDGSTPVQLSLVSAEAATDVVRLHWYVADSPALPATLFRRTTGTDWSPLRVVLADGAGHIDAEDRDVAPGERYGYRLGIDEGSGVTFAGEVWVVVPVAATFSLRATWDRHEGAVRVECSLPVANPAALDVFDVGGRRVAREHIGGTRPGSHVVMMRLGDGLSPGIVFIRLRQGNAEARARVVITH